MGAFPNPVAGRSNVAGGYFGDNVSPTYAPVSSNQYFTGMPSMGNPGQSPFYNGGAPQPQNPYQAPPQGSTSFQTDPATAKSHQTDIGSGLHATNLQYPGMSQDFTNYLQSQLGMGLSPYSGSTPLPTGGTTQPGQLTAGLNPLLQSLMQFFQGGRTAAPGANTLSDIANNGISALPEWQAMIAAQGQNIAQNQANMKEQFGSMGNLAGSPFATAESNYMSQTSLDQNALLGQLQQTNILQGQIPVAQGLMSGATAMASGLQNLDQASIDAYVKQFQTDQPQNNPLMQDMMGMATLYPPTTRTPTTWDMVNNTIGAISGAGYSSSSSAGGATSTALTF